MGRDFLFLFLHVHAERARVKRPFSYTFFRVRVCWQYHFACGFHFLAHMAAPWRNGSRALKPRRSAALSSLSGATAMVNVTPPQASREYKNISIVLRYLGFIDFINI